MRKRLLLIFVLLIACRQSDPVVWQLALAGRIYADPFIENGRVYIGASSGQIVCADLKTGKKIWEKKLDGAVVASPAVSSRAVFAATQRGKVFALDKNNGNQVWQRAFKENEGFEAPLTFNGELLLAPSDQGNLYALSPENGATAWIHPGGGKYNTAAISLQSNIYIGGWSKDFYSIKSDGTENWKFKATDRIVENALIFENRVYFPSHDRFVHCLDAQTGRLLWRFEASYPTNLVLINGNLVFGSSSYMYVLEPRGGRLLQKIQLSRIIERIAPAGNACLAVTDRILKFDPRSGSKAQSIRLPNKARIFKVLANDGLYLVTDDLYSMYGLNSEGD